MSDETNRFDITAKLNRVDTFVTKTGKKLLTLVMETGGQWPQLIPIKLLGRAAERADELGVGDVLQISGRLGGRDYNGRCFGDNVANSIEVVSKAKHPESKGAVPANDAPPADSDPPPF
jgi:hypothetical protein